MQRSAMRHSRQNTILAFYLLYAAAATLAYAVSTAHRFPSSHDWALEDWLVNYSGGFVRRGLPGTLASALGRGLHVAPSWLAAAGQAACYLTVFASAWLLLRRSSEHSPWTWALVLSPAAFAFQLLDHVGGFRKEILFFAGLGMLLLSLRRSVKPVLVSVALSVWLPCLVLSHESAFFYLGYYALVILLHERHRLPQGFILRSARILGIPLLLSALAMAAISLHPGNRAIAAAVCASVEHVPLNQCGQGLRYLSSTPSEAHADASAAFHRQNYPLIYAILGSFALAPIAVLLRAGLRHDPTRSDALLVTGVAAMTALFSLPLYLFAVDWGRWIYMDVLSLSLILFSLDWDHCGVVLPGRCALSCGFRPALPATLALLCYMTLWSLPHLPVFGQFYGYAQRIEHAKVFRRLVLHRGPLEALTPLYDRRGSA